MGSKPVWRFFITVTFVLILFHQVTLAQPKTRTVTLIHSSNFYGDVGPYNYYNDFIEAKGLVFYASYVNELRRTDRSVIVIDTGNFLYGTPFADHFLHRDDNPVLELLNMVKPDAIVPGTLELELGVDTLSKVLRKVQSKVLAANVRNLPSSVSYIVVDLGDNLKVGIVGVVPRYGKYTFEDEKRKVREAVDALRQKEKVSFVVLATSAGISVEPGGTKVLALSSPLTLGSELVRDFSRDVDVFLFGNQALTLALVRGGKTYSLPGAGGYGVNRIVLTAEHDGKSWKLKSSSVAQLLFTAVTPNEKLVSWLQTYESAVNLWLEQPVLKASAAVPFHKYMAILDDNVATEAITKVLMRATGAKLGFWGIYNQHFNGLEQGDVTRRDIYKMVGPVVGLKVVAMRGRELQSILEREGQLVDYASGKIKLSSKLISSPWLITLLEGAKYAYVANTEKVVWEEPDFRPEAEYLVVTPAVRVQGELIPSSGRIVSEIERPIVNIFLDNFRSVYPDGTFPALPDNNRTTALELKHTVQAGESLRTLVNRLGLTLDHILRHNPQIKDPNIIRPGWVITYYKKYLELVPPFQEFFTYE